MPPLCQYESQNNWNAVKLLSHCQLKGKLVNVLTRWMWSEEAKTCRATTDLAASFPPDQNHTIKRQDAYFFWLVGNYSHLIRL